MQGQRANIRASRFALTYSPLLVTVRLRAVLTWSSDSKLGHSFIGEAVPDAAEEVPAFGFGTQELLVIVVRKSEVSVDIAATESQVQSALVGVVCHREKHLRFKR